MSKIFVLVFIGCVIFSSHTQSVRSQTVPAKPNGRVELRVWDRSVKKFIYAGLGIYPVKVRQRKFFSMSTATGDDGASHTLTLAPGSYLAKVERYLCNGKTYFSSRPPSFGFVIRPSRLKRKTLIVDVSKIRAKGSYDNPGGESCSK